MPARIDPKGTTTKVRISLTPTDLERLRALRSLLRLRAGSRTLPTPTAVVRELLRTVAVWRSWGK